MADSDDEIRFRLTVTAQDAIGIIKKFRAEVDATKNDMLKLSKEVKASFADTAKGMMKAFSTKEWGKFNPLGMNPQDIAASKAAITNAIKERNQVVMQAAKELTQAEADEFKAYQVQQRQKVDLSKMSAKERMAFEKQLQTTLKSFDKQRTDESIRLSKLRSAEDRKNAKEILAQQKATAKGTGILGNAFTKLGGVIKNAFSFFLGGTIFAFIYRLVNGFQELIRNGEEYAQTIYRLGVSINQLQRRGMDITVKSEIELIKSLQKEYDVFSKKSVISAVAAVQMLTRNFGFSQEQIRKTIELSMDLALVQGKDVAETAKMLALFYSSGYGEGLQHAGLAVNRMTVAQEAQRMGMKKSYMQLTELERASAAYVLVERQTVDLHGDAMHIMDGVIGQIKEQRAGIENVTNEIALRALPVELAWLKVKLYFVQILKQQIDANEAYNDSVVEIAEEQGKALEKMSPAQQDWFEIINQKAISERQKEKLKEIKEEWEKILSGTLDVSPDVNLDLENQDEELAQARAELGEMIIKVWDDLVDAQNDYNNKSEELTKDHNKKLEELDMESADKRAELWYDFQNKLLEIQQDLDQDIADYQTDFQRENADLDREYQLSIQDSNRKYHEEEIKAERDYQEKLRRLREEYLFDLEDALRERDALQILRLMRRYKLDKEQAEREKDKDQQDRKDSHSEELDDLARQHAEQERQNRESLARQIADANLAAERKREDARINYERALAEEVTALQKQRDEETAKYKERQDELAADLEERFNKILTEFGNEIGVTGSSLDTVASLFKSYLGKQGVVAATIDEYIAKLSEAAEATDAKVQQMEAALASLQAITASTLGQTNLTPTTLNPNPSIPYTGGHAKGLPPTLLTRPQMFMAGEVPEVMSITPVSQMNSNGIGGANGKGTIEITLGQDLEGRIIDNTLGEVAIVLKKGLEER